MKRGWFCGLVLVSVSFLAAGAEARTVKINGVALGDEQLRSLEQTYQVGIRDGDYWYDKKTGGWGLQGGPQLGLVVPGLELGGPLRSDASGRSGTGVFVNGRELHLQDVGFLQQFTVVLPGRYWVDAHGNGGYEGGPLMFNLVLLARRAMAQRSGGSGDKAWSHYKDYGSGSISVASDGEGGFYYSGRDVALDRTESYSTGP